METKYKKISDFFNPISNPAGGMPVKFGVQTKAPSAPVLSTATANSTPQNVDLKKLAEKREAQRTLSTLYGGGFNMNPTPAKKPIVMPAMPAPGPMSRIPQGPVQSNLPVGGNNAGGGSFGGGQSSPLFGGQNPPPAPKNETPAVPSQWMRPDGTMKTPEEIANEVAGTLKAGQGPDIGKLAGDQFGGQGKSAVELAAEAAQINNTRNDIAVGENDPYKVAAQSGIAYTPQELQAIESAYAGIYDPAITTALAKVEQKQAEDAAAAEAKVRQDEIRLQAELDATAPFTLGQDQVRYGADGKPLAVGLSSDSGGVGTGVYTPGSNPTVDAFVKGIRTGAYKASDIPDEYKALVAQGMATQPAISETSTGAVSVINELLANPAIDRLAGLSSIFPIVPGGEAAEAATLAKQLKGILSLENREQLKGSGAISDFEFKVLGQAASALGINDDTGRTSLSEEDFKFQLDKLKLKLEVGETTLTDDELLYLRDEKGYTPQQIRDYSTQQSFGSVGNTSASTGQGNRPQRNNNPGNVKQGGLADPLAVGVDDQGHLIFPDAATGFKAMRADILAKVNGNSRFLPPNPTIAQLGKVYAEDQNWPNSVSRLLGVSPNTPTANIPIDKLVQAIATQEGFYA